MSSNEMYCIICKCRMLSPLVSIAASSIQEAARTYPTDTDVVSEAQASFSCVTL